NVWDVFKDLRNTPLGQKYQQVMQNRVPAEFETSGVFHNAIYRVNIYPSAEGISVFAQEVSRRKQSEQPVENLDKFPSENPHPVFRVDLNGKLLYANPASQEVLKGWGISGSGVVPEHIRDIARQSFSGNCPGLVEERIGEKTFQVDFTPIQNEGYVNIYMVDQTLRKRTEEDLKTARNEAIREKNRLLAVMQVLPAGLSITDPAGMVVMANTAYERVWGHPIPETLSVHDYAAFHAWWLDTGQPVKPEEWASAQAVQQGKMVAEQMLKIQRFDGSDAYVLNSAVPIIDAQGNVTGSVVVIQDITNLYKLQTELKAANQDLQSIMDAAPAYIWITHDRQARNMTGNRATYELLQIKSGENLSKTAPDVRLTRDYKTFKDGKEVPSKLLPVQRAAAGETIHNYEVDYVFDDGEVIRLVGNAAPLSNVPGNSEGAVGVFIDITLRKRMEEELRKLNEQLKNSNQELEKFAIIASHDMQEPLRKIISFSNILLAGGENLSETQRDYVMRLNSASSRMKRMIADLLDLSRISSHGGAFGRVDLGEVTAEVISDLEMQIRSADARIELGPLPVIEGDAMQMHQLMQNLIGNAVKFHKADQKPRVQITGRRISPTSVQIMVEDDGIGFDETEADRIFRPFERLVGRSEYEGTGIGLAICEKIVARHAGEITVRSTPGVGSVFTITLPG
ncbi:MAG: ATP-binding protein, partial [Anaerolineaceae bacterium]